MTICIISIELIVLALHDVHKIKAYWADCVCLSASFNSRSTGYIL
jgi:hypothetical protein